VELRLGSQLRDHVLDVLQAGAGDGRCLGGLVISKALAHISGVTAKTASTDVAVVAKGVFPFAPLACPAAVRAFVQVSFSFSGTTVVVLIIVVVLTTNVDSRPVVRWIVNRISGRHFALADGVFVRCLIRHQELGCSVYRTLSITWRPR
jgi:hypothetical protein